MFKILWLAYDLIRLDWCNRRYTQCGTMQKFTTTRFWLVFPTRVFPNPKPVFFGYFLLPETRIFSTAKPGYFKNFGIAVAFKY